MKVALIFKQIIVVECYMGKWVTINPISYRITMGLRWYTDSTEQDEYCISVVLLPSMLKKRVPNKRTVMDHKPRCLDT